MTEIRLHNSATREKEIFAPEDARDVRMYVCGPTVYDRAHIGNARPAVVFDVLFRLLRHTYGDDHVTYVRNITDIDDKIMARAKERGVLIDEITAETMDWYRDDMAALGCLPPTHEPRATEFVPEMVAMIEVLIAKGNAYAVDGHVLFEVATYPEYGRLSGRSTGDMIAGARAETAPGKRSPMDFVLWKPSAGDQPGWDSPWGRGRPGWHIECSAMASKLLGETFDIHGGGADLMFPHHENEIAQSCCAAPDSGFARVWMHNGMIRVGGKKMSKSLGNFLTVEDLHEQAPGEVLRLALLSTHYRGTLDWNQQKVDEAESSLLGWRFAESHTIETSNEPSEEFMSAICDDLNTPAAISELHRLYKSEDYPTLVASARMLGLLDDKMGGWFSHKVSNRPYHLHGEAVPGIMVPSDANNDEASAVGRLIALRFVLRRRKDFKTADMIRDFLEDSGVSISEGIDSIVWSRSAIIPSRRIVELEKLGDKVDEALK